MKNSAVSLTALAVILAGCSGDNDASDGGVSMLPKEHRSPNFETTAQYLDLGGSYYAYMDLSGQLESYAPAINDFLQMMSAEMGGMMPPVDADKIFQTLGLYSIESYGVSSYQLENGLYVAKGFLQLEGGPEGIFRLMGAEPSAFAALNYAPAGTDYLASLSFDGRELLDLANNLAISVGGEQMASMLDQALERPVPEMDRSIRELIEGAQTQAVILIDLETEERYEFTELSGEPLSLPVPNVALLLKGQGWLLDTAPGEMQQMIVEADGVQRLPIPLPGDDLPEFFSPVIVRVNESDDLLVISSQAFADRILGEGGRLVDSGVYQTAMGDLPSEGIAMSFATPVVYEEISRLMDRVKSEMPDEMGFIFTLYGMFIPSLSGEVPATAIGSVATFNEDGLFAHGLAMGSPPPVFTGGSELAFVGVLGGGMILRLMPTERMIEEVMNPEMALQNNLRQIASAGQQYLLEEGDEEVSVTTLVEDDYFLNELAEPVKGESYEDLVVNYLGGELSVTLDDGTVVTYEY